MDLSFAKTRQMNRKAIVRLCLALITFPLLFFPDLFFLFRIFFLYCIILLLISLLSFSYSGLYFKEDDTIAFKRRFKRFLYHTSQVGKIEFSELGYWGKMGFSGLRMIAPAFTFPILNFYLIDSYGQYIKYKVFVNTFKKDGVALQAFLERLQELNPSLIVPDVQAFNATLK